jgi:drug/metabolite transporter (DMT)-like permease
MEPWVILTLISAFSLATSDALTKRIITPENEYMIAWIRVVFALPGLSAAVALSGPIPKLDHTFFTVFFVALPLEVVSILLYYKALRLSPLSLSLPFLSLTPVFLIILSFVLVHQGVSFMGGAGIGLIALGGYTLNLSALSSGFLGPFRAIMRERGSRYMLIVAFLYSITSALGKIGVSHSSAPFFGATYMFALAVCMLPVMARRSGRGRLPGLFRSSIRIALLPALFDAISTIAYYYAISIANVAYMIALKRTSLLFGVCYGFLLFRERHVRERLLGAILMFAGFILVVLYS